MRDTELVFSSICNYMWGLRHWMRLQHQADPAVGVIGYLDFIKSIKVPTFALGEPRRRVPRRVLKRILETCDLSDFVQVQACFIFLVLWFLHSRTEPFPKNHTGEESFDSKKHWLARDFTVRTFPFGFLFGVRQKAIKQDPRIERESAHGDGLEWGDAAAVGGHDFSYIGDVPGNIFSIFLWYRRFM